MNIQLRMKDGIPFIFEINPRFSSTVYIRSIIGFPDLEDWIRHKTGLKRNLLYTQREGSEVCRYFDYKIINR